MSTIWLIRTGPDEEPLLPYPGGLGPGSRDAAVNAVRANIALGWEVVECVAVPVEKCVCIPPPMTEGPAEDCPIHGREYSWWVDAVGRVEHQLEETEEAVRTLSRIIVAVGNTLLNNRLHAEQRIATAVQIIRERKDPTDGGA